VEKFDLLIHEQLIITEEMIGLQQDIDLHKSYLNKISMTGLDKNELIELLIKIAHKKKRLEELQLAFRERTDEIIEYYKDTKVKNLPNS
jgi:hypothetical protein